MQFILQFYNRDQFCWKTTHSILKPTSLLFSICCCWHIKGFLFRSCVSQKWDPCLTRERKKKEIKWGRCMTQFYPYRNWNGFYVVGFQMDAVTPLCFPNFQNEVLALRVTSAVDFSTVLGLLRFPFTEENFINVRPLFLLFPLLKCCLFFPCWPLCLFQILQKCDCVELFFSVASAESRTGKMSVQSVLALLVGFTASSPELGWTHQQSHACKLNYAAF